MAAKKTAPKKEEQAPEPAPADAPVGGIAAEDLHVLEGDVDSRMAALLKDHQKMGARPK